MFYKVRVTYNGTDNNSNSVSYAVTNHTAIAFYLVAILMLRRPDSTLPE